MKKILLLITFGLFINLNAQNIKLKTILDATATCSTPEEFRDYLSQYDFCFGTKNERETFTYYTHFKCGQSSIGEKGLRVNFAVSRDGSLNSSFLTKNKRRVKGYRKELKKFNFKEVPASPDEAPRPNATWFSSENYEGLQILWEYLGNEEEGKTWHIGFVWNSPPEE